jgi:hypothetical protein
VGTAGGLCPRTTQVSVDLLTGERGVRRYQSQRCHSSYRLKLALSKTNSGLGVVTYTVKALAVSNHPFDKQFAIGNIALYITSINIT